MTEYPAVASGDMIHSFSQNYGYIQEKKFNVVLTSTFVLASQSK
jgi:hypothetical protein